MNPPERQPAYEPVKMPISMASPTDGLAQDAQPPRSPRASDGDADLLRRMASGDESALGALYDRWSAQVHALVLHLLRDGDEAEDVVEEVFWQAWRQAARYESARGTVATWMLTIARSRALDRLRARRRLREEPMPETASDTEIDERAEDPSVFTEAGERRKIVRAALEALPQEQREALELAYFGGLSQTEIAEKTGLPLGTVKTRMRLAMLKLKERLSVLRESPA
jgi:RNA polymerase sigma-70 factor (ECF subfamily)